MIILDISVLICLLVKDDGFGCGKSLTSRASAYCLECLSAFQSCFPLSSLKWTKAVIIATKSRAIQNEPDIIWEHACSL